MAHHFFCESGGTADAPGSGPGVRKGVGVQIPPLAPNLMIIMDFLDVMGYRVHDIYFITVCCAAYR